MNGTRVTNTSLENATDSSTIIVSKAEGIAWCSAVTLVSLFIAVGNVLTIVLFAVNKTLRKKSLFLVINMAFADLMLGVLTLPGYIVMTGSDFQLWTGVEITSFGTVNKIIDTFFSQGALISAVFISGERFYAVYWPFKHRTLSTRAYRIVIFMVWTLALLISAVLNGLLNYFSIKHSMYAFSPYILILMFIICGCNISIWGKFQDESVASQQQSKVLQTKRLTKTLLFVSVLALLSWLPLVITSFLIDVFQVPMSFRFNITVDVLNYSNSFVNPVVYALRIPEFKQALAFCCLGREEVLNDERDERRNNTAAAVTPATQLRTLRTNLSSHIHLAYEPDIMDTKL